jgi:hypothetical protein
MMLMIGECVLQLVIAEPKYGGVRVTQASWNGALISGFVLALAMCYSFNVTEPHHATGHAFARSSRPAALYLLLLPPKALSILVTGVSIKLVFYQPEAPLEEQLALTQKLLLSVSLASCFFLQLIRQPLHVVGITNYYSLKRLWQNPGQALTIILRLALLGGMVATSWAADVQMWQFVVVQAGCAMGYCALHMTEVQVLPSKVRHSVKAWVSRRTSDGESRQSAASATTARGGTSEPAPGPNHAPPGRMSQRNRNKASCMIRPSRPNPISVPTGSATESPVAHAAGSPTVGANKRPKASCMIRSGSASRLTHRLKGLVGRQDGYAGAMPPSVAEDDIDASSATSSTGEKQNVVLRVIRE